MGQTNSKQKQVGKVVTAQEQQEEKTRTKHESLLNTITRNHRRHSRSNTTKLSIRRTVWNPFRAAAASLRRRPHSNHLQHPSSRKPEPELELEQELEQEPELESESELEPEPEAAIITDEEEPPMTPDDQHTEMAHTQATIPPEPAAAYNDSPDQQLASSGSAPDADPDAPPLPEPDASTPVDRPAVPAVGIQTPARRIYVQGMVVVRNVNESPLPSAAAGIPPSHPPEPAHPTSTTSTTDHHPQSTDSHGPIPSDAIDLTTGPVEEEDSHPHPTSNQPSSPASGPPPEAPTDPATTSMPPHSIAQVQLEQAAMISRLLSAAAAATASSLLPYAIHADGSSIQSRPSNAQSPALSPYQASHPIDMPFSEAEAEAEAHHRPPGTLPEQQQQPYGAAGEHERDSHAGLQTTLRDALRAAFGGALVNASSGDASEQPSPASPASMGRSSSVVPSSPEPSSAQSPADASLDATASPAGTSSSSRRTSSRIMRRLGLASRAGESSSFSQPPGEVDASAAEEAESEDVPTAAVPGQSATAEEDPLAAGAGHGEDTPGGFERFLRDLQTDVGDAILLALGARQQPPAVAQEELDERVRHGSALPFAPDENDENDEQQQDTMEEPVEGPAFNFFRMHRFEGVHPPSSTTTSTSSGTPSPTLIPVLLVGVRSAPPNPLLGALERIASHAAAATAAAAATTPAFTAPPLIPSHTDPRLVPVDVNALNASVHPSLDPNVQDETVEENEAMEEDEIVVGSDGEDEDAAAHGHDDQPELPDPTARPTAAASPPDAPSSLSSATPRSWLIFVLAGLYPESHPIFTAPSLFIPQGLQTTEARSEAGGSRMRSGDEGEEEDESGSRSEADTMESQLLDYEAMVRLAELLGPLRPPGFPAKPAIDTLTQTQIDQSRNFTKLRFADLAASSPIPRSNDLPLSPTNLSLTPADPPLLVPRRPSRKPARGFGAREHVEKCLICLDEYEDEEQVQIMACKHMFHKSCVDQWLVKCAASCPVCRRPAVS
ncbi:hypothetical protein PCASD_04437 [Puccinia coronata f. sp. avenae]|uniref:RING-type domain-containing protein n=1 Tax=Puccinia coronata f. sp. avenae TaxID=200324 RepID=A0A2N5VBV2_9BASI|nr:hypothetical protein PCASD_04437 [Puccinia coronata f. sp. avenae]